MNTWLLKEILALFILACTGPLYSSSAIDALVPGEALHFDDSGANDYVDIGNWHDWDLSQPFTIEVNVFRESEFDLGALISCSDGSWDPGMHLRISGERLRLTLKGGVADDILQVESSDFIPINTWQMMTVTYDGSLSAAGVKIYIEGLLVAMTIVDDDLTIASTTSYPTLLGRQADHFSNFGGIMDEMRIWDRVLCPEEIETRSGCELLGSEPGLLAYYHFNQGLASADNSFETTLIDGSGNGHDGSLINFALSGSTSNWVLGDSFAGACADVIGCTDSSACNYDPTFVCDDGSCLYPDGCTDAAACNYNPLAQCDDGSCTFPGCTDVNAANYDSAAGCDDGSCSFAEALHFDGTNDYVDLGNWHSWNTANSFTVEAVVFIEQDLTFNTIIASSSNVYANAGFHLMVNQSAGIRFTLKNGTGEVLQLDAPITSVAGSWAHITVSYDGTLDESGVSIYLDGNPLAYNIVFNDLSSHGSTSNPTYIGQQTGGIRQLNGIIDEVRIWDRVLCEEEVLDRVNCELDGNQTGLSAYYRFDHGQAFGSNLGITTLSDYSPNGHDGTLNNFALTGATSNWVLGDSNTSTCADVFGCTDPLACNYNSIASCDDGSCILPDGCMDSGACNYNLTAVCDDGSCVYPGCTDGLACNYDSSAGCDDGSCELPDGCTDPSACNYDPAALCDDGSCLLPGCTNSAACNYDSTAVCDDGTCAFPGCNDPAATNYDLDAGCDDGSCFYTPAEALNFDGFSDYINIGNWNDWDFSQPFTIEVNANLHANPDTYTLISCSGGSLLEPGMNFLVMPDGKLRITLKGVDENNVLTVESTQPILKNTWQMLGVTYDGSMSSAGVNLYNEGIALTTTIISDNLNVASPVTSDTYLGSQLDGFNEFDGIMDEVRIWSRELCPQEILARADCELQGDEFGIEAYYDFNQGIANANNSTETTLIDRSANGYDGTLNTFNLQNFPGSNWTFGDAFAGACLTANVGCLDSTACNYDANVACDDGTCTYPGCNDVYATNYDPLAGCDDGSCTYPFAQALHFDGIDDYVDLGTWHTWNTSDAFTFEADVLIDQDLAFNTIVGSTTNNNNEAGFHLMINQNSGIRFTLKNGTGEVMRLEAPVASLVGTWAHISVSYDGGLDQSGVVIYLDGTPLAFNAVLNNLSSHGSTTNPTHLGQQIDGYRPFVGIIDEVRIWNRVLCEAEVNSRVDCILNGDEFGLDAYYKLNHGFAYGDNPGVTTLADQSGSGHDGTLNNFALTGATSNWVSGDSITGICPDVGGCTDSNALNYDSGASCDNGSCTYLPGEALHFDFVSNSSVDLGDWHMCSTTKPFTVEARILLEQVESVYYGVILSSTNASGANPGFMIGTVGDDEIVFTLKNGAGQSIEVSAAISSIEGNWAHISVSYDGSLGASGVKMYLNGNPNEQMVLSNTLSFHSCSNHSTRIGQNTSGGDKFKGTIDEVRIWNRVLCDDEILDRANCELIGTEAGLDAYYNFNQGDVLGDNSEITTLIDHSGNSHHGTLISFGLIGATSNWVLGDNFSGSCTAVSGIGCTDSSACNYDPLASCDDGSCITEADGCTDPLACNYNSNAACDDGSCDYSDTDGDGILDCFDNCPHLFNADQADFDLDDAGDACEDSDGDGLSDAIELASGIYDPTIPDTNGDGCDDLQDFSGSCLVQGCTYPDADNYDIAAESDDGSCEFTPSSCPGDINEDGAVDTSDLLAFLGVFGSVCP